MLRLFLALPQNEVILQIIRHFSEKNTHLPFRFVAEKNLHVTTTFLGDFPGAQLADLILQLEAFYSSLPDFTLHFDKIDYDPGRRFPRMIWAYFKIHPDFDAHVMQTQEQLYKIYKGMGLKFKKEKRKVFIPHITLCRFNPKKSLVQEIQPCKNEELILQANQVGLYKSSLLPSGADYKMLHKFALRESFKY